MIDFYVGQIFENEYPPEAAAWTNEYGYYIDDIEPIDGVRRYQIVRLPQPTPEEQEAEFNRQFFNTSLGYVRRKVTMQNGDKRDFLCDILPLLQVGVPILTYTRDLQQNSVFATEQFINECKQQMLTDFYGN